MTKIRELTENSTGEKIKLSSGVEVVVKPFPSGLWSALQAKTLEDFPDPKPPKKTITVVDGTEEVDNLDDPDYQVELNKVRRERNNLLGEAIIDLCIDVELKEFEETIKRLERYSSKYPKDEDDRRVRFLTDYALRTKGDYEAMMISATTQMMIGDPEVAARLKSFRHQMAQSTPDNSNAPGSDEKEPLAV